MSFILDALRKSEHERHRQTGPTLVEGAVATHRSRKNVWATAAIVLLVVNLFAFGFLLLHMSRNGAPEAATEAGTAARNGAGPALPTPSTAVTQTRRQEPPPMFRPAQPAPPLRTSRNPLADEVSPEPAPLEPTLSRGAEPPAGPPAVTSLPRRGGTVVYEPVPEAGPMPVPAAALPPAPSGLPLADEMMAPGGTPELRLELHVYSDRPEQRFVFINSRKYREGEVLQEGPTVEQIRADGVVLNQQGRRFLLPRD